MPASSTRWPRPWLSALLLVGLLLGGAAARADSAPDSARANSARARANSARADSGPLHQQTEAATQPAEQADDSPATQPASSPASLAAAAASSATADRPRWLVPQLHAAGLLLATRVGASLLWPSAFDPTPVRANAGRFSRAWSTPPEWDSSAPFFEWDGDPWALNLVGHGLLGSELYLRHRQAGQPVWVSLAMTATWSLIWEYLIEAWHKHPSGIDMIWTPLGGMALGEGRYQIYQLIRARPPSVSRKLLLYLIDPLGQLERDLFGMSY